MKNEFISPKFSLKFIDRYYHRKSLFMALSKSLSEMNGQLLDVGCGKMPYREHIMKNSKVKEYVGLEIDAALDYGGERKPDVFWDGIKMPLESNSFDSAMAGEVFEHCPDLDLILKEIARVLKPGGTLYFTVPFLWTFHESPHDECRYTPFHLRSAFEKNGFEIDHISSLGGWNASLAQVLALWSRRSTHRKWLQFMMSLSVLPWVVLLNKLDRIPKGFGNNQMHTGFYGVLRRK